MDRCCSVGTRRKSGARGEGERDIWDSVLEVFSVDSVIDVSN